MTETLQPSAEEVVSTEPVETVDESANVEASQQQEPSQEELWAKEYAKVAESQRRLHNQQKAFEAEKNKYSQYANIQKLAEEGKGLEILSQLGISIEDVLNGHLDQYEEDTRTPEQKRIDELESKLNGFESSAKEREEQQIKQLEEQKTQQVLTAQKGLADYAQSKIEDYPVLNTFHKGESLGEILFETAQVIYDETGKATDYDELCEILEAELREQYAPILKDLSKKEQVEENPQQEQVVRNNRRVEPPKPIVSRTLSNSDAASTSSIDSKPTNRILTKEERRARADKLFLENL